MSNINDIMEDLQEETQYMMVDGKPVTIRKVIDDILRKDDDEKNRKLGIDA